MNSNFANSLIFLYPQVVRTSGETAYDADGNEVVYDKNAVQEKIIELETQYAEQQQTQATAKASAIAKLTAIGLTQAEITALIGV
jgi:hypothetical protein